jgi:uncharacterized RDD family membrane protein YckC
MELRLASRKRRFIAHWLDQLYCVTLFLGIANLLLLIPPVAELFEGYIADAVETNSAAVSGVPYVFLSIAVAYNLLYFSKESFRGTSPGKYMMGIAVRHKGNPESVPSVAKLFTRNIPLLIWPVEGVVSAVSSDKRRFGDMMTDSIVLKIGKSKKLLLPLTTFPILMVFLTTLSFNTTTSSSLAVKKSDAYKAATEYMYNNDFVKAQIGEIQNLGDDADGQIEIKNGYGKATITISVYGKLKDAKAELLLEKTPDYDWQVVEFTLSSEP